MKNFLGKRLVSLLLALVMVFGLIPVLATPKAEAAVDHVALKNMINSLKYPLAERITNKANIGGLCLIVGDGNAIMNPDIKGQTDHPIIAGQLGIYNHYGIDYVEVSSNAATARISDAKYVTYITSPSSGVYHSRLTGVIAEPGVTIGASRL